MKQELEFFLLPNSRVETRTLSDLYRRAFSEARELYVVSAFLTEWDSELEIKDNCTFKIIVGKDFGITRKKACQKVLKWLGSDRRDCFYVAQNIAGFHPKAMFWEDSRGDCHLLAGSSNLTKAAFNTNHEANAYSTISQVDFERAQSWCEAIITNSVPVTPSWISAYSEAKLRGTGAQATKKHTRDPRFKDNKSSLASLLPRFAKAEADQLIKDRRKQLRAFVKIKPGLKKKIFECANKQIGNEMFYQYLKKTWDKTSRFQGKGWERTGRKSNFSTLCAGLKSILVAADEDRNRVVVRTIDHLARNRIPTRGALLSELLCQFFPDRYPVLDGPVRWLAKSIKLQWPHGLSEGARYNFLTQTISAALKREPEYPAKNMAELDLLIWKKHSIETGRS
jgi:HKD family nuclease